MGKEPRRARRKVARYRQGAHLVTAPKFMAAVSRMRSVCTRSQTGTPRPLIACCPRVAPVMFRRVFEGYSKDLRRGFEGIKQSPCSSPRLPLPRSIEYRRSQGPSSYTFFIPLRKQVVPAPRSAAAAFCEFYAEARIGKLWGFSCRRCGSPLGAGERAWQTQGCFQSLPVRVIAGPECHPL